MTSVRVALVAEKLLDIPSEISTANNNRKPIPTDIMNIVDTFRDYP